MRILALVLVGIGSILLMDWVFDVVQADDAHFVQLIEACAFMYAAGFARGYDPKARRVQR